MSSGASTELFLGVDSSPTDKSRLRLQGLCEAPRELKQLDLQVKCERADTGCVFSELHRGTARLNGSVSVDLSCFPSFFCGCELDWNWTLLGVVERTKQSIHQVDWTSPTQTHTHTHTHTHTYNNIERSFGLLCFCSAGFWTQIFHCCLR